MPVKRGRGRNSIRTLFERGPSALNHFYLLACHAFASVVLRRFAAVDRIRISQETGASLTKELFVEPVTDEVDL